MNPTTITVDRSGWPSGAWDHEPDRLEWRSPTGFACLILRQQRGHLCGYVAVPPGHPLHGIDYNERSDRLVAALDARKEQPLGENPSFALLIRCAFGVDEFDPTPETVFSVHGGITHSGACQGAICHVAKDGEPDDVWWFGFDAAHCDDWSPGSHEFDVRHGFKRHGAYCDVEYMKAETERLAAQLAEVAK